MDLLEILNTLDTLKVQAAIILFALVLGLIFLNFGFKRSKWVTFSVGLFLIAFVVMQTMKLDSQFGEIIQTLSSLFAVLVSIIAIASTMNFRISDKKERNSFDILKWAIEINTFASRNNTEAIKSYNDTQREQFLFAHRDRYVFDIIDPKISEGIYMLQLSESLGNDLKNEVGELRDLLQLLSAFLILVRREKAELGEKDIVDQIAEYNNDIFDSTNRVIGVVAIYNSKNHVSII